MGIFREIFCWWDGNTWGTRLTIWNQGRFVGKDDFGNRYYEQKKGEGFLGKPRRWVTYTDLAEPSKVPADWHGWLHHTWDETPQDRPLAHKHWEKPHQENLTGTALAYAPAGSIRREHPADRGDYEAWSPE